MGPYLHFGSNLVKVQAIIDSEGSASSPLQRSECSSDTIFTGRVAQRTRCVHVLRRNNQCLSAFARDGSDVCASSTHNMDVRLHIKALNRSAPSFPSSSYQANVAHLREIPRLELLDVNSLDVHSPWLHVKVLHGSNSSPSRQPMVI